jgi:hypothetical protein
LVQDEWWITQDYIQGIFDNPTRSIRSTASEINDGTNANIGRGGLEAHVGVVDGPPKAISAEQAIIIYRGCPVEALASRTRKTGSTASSLE